MWDEFTTGRKTIKGLTKEGTTLKQVSPRFRNAQKAIYLESPKPIVKT